MITICWNAERRHIHYTTERFQTIPLPISRIPNTDLVFRDFASEALRYIKDWAMWVHAMVDGCGQVIVEIDYSIVPFTLLKLILKYVVFM